MISERYRTRLLRESLKDEQHKDRSRFEYVSDVVAENCVVPFSIWVEPNSLIRKVVNGETRFDSWPFDELNEVHKGMLLKDQAEFVARHEGKTLLCEALNAQQCLQTECPFFITVGAIHPMINRHGQPLCGEFKITFEK